MKYTKNIKSRKHIKSEKLQNQENYKIRKHIKLRKHIKSRKQKRNIKLIIKDLGKKTKKYKRIQYIVNLKGGGPAFQPFSYITRAIENGMNNAYNTVYGIDTQEYNYTNY